MELTTMKIGGSFFGHKVRISVLEPGSLSPVSVQVPGDKGVIGQALNAHHDVVQMPRTVAEATITTVKDIAATPGAVRAAAEAVKGAAEGTHDRLADALNAAISSMTEITRGLSGIFYQISGASGTPTFKIIISLGIAILAVTLVTKVVDLVTRWRVMKKTP